MIPFDYIIKNAHIVDPACGVDETGTLYVDGGFMVRCDCPEKAEAREEVIDAKGCLVLPGLIDFHTHCNHAVSPLGISADMHLIPNGITATVDMGTTGHVGYKSFRDGVIGPSSSTIKAYLNLASAGCPSEDLLEDYRHEKLNFRETARVFNENRDTLLGIKVRLGNGAPGLGVAPLRDAVAMAGMLSCPVCVHIGGLESKIWEVCDLLRPGDILTHMFDGKGETILDENGKVHPSVMAARERGVIFDLAAAKRNYNLSVAKKAMDNGFMPDVLSSDVTTLSVYKNQMFMLPMIMSWIMALGMEKKEVIRAVTGTPARLMGMEGVIGTLAPGAYADIAIFRETPANIMYRDFFGNGPVNVRELLVPKLTMKKGQMCYKDMAFAFGCE